MEQGTGGEPEEEQADSETAEEAEEESDVLLTEAGNVLVDALLMRQRAYAVHATEKEEAR